MSCSISSLMASRMASMLSKPKSDLTSSSVSSGVLRTLMPLTVTSTVWVSASSPSSTSSVQVTVLDVVNVGADQGLVELLGVAVATGDEHAALGGKVVGVLDGLEVDGNVVLGLDGATLDVLEGSAVVEEHLDLVVNLGLGDLRRGHLDLDSVEGGELGSRTQGELDGVGVVLVILGEVELLVVTVLGGDDVQLVEDGGLVGCDQVVGGLSEGSLGAKSGVDDRTGSLTGTEAREAVLLGGVLVGLLDRGVDVGGRDGDRSGELGVLDVRSGDVQHVPPHTAQLI